MHPGSCSNFINSPCNSRTRALPVHPMVKLWFERCRIILFIWKALSVVVNCVAYCRDGQNVEEAECCRSRSSSLSALAAHLPITSLAHKFIFHFYLCAKKMFHSKCWHNLQLWRNEHFVIDRWVSEKPAIAQFQSLKMAQRMKETFCEN